MTKRLLFLVALLLAIGIPRQARASENVQYLIIKAGTETVAVALADEPVITYANDKITISTTEKQVEIPVADISGYSFTDVEPSAIRNIEIGHQYKHGMVAFDNLKAGSSVTLCNVKGEQIRTITALSDGTAVIDMQGLMKGIYIIHAEKLSFKIINN